MLDFDNTLFNNDQLLAEFHSFLDNVLGQQKSRNFWRISEQLRHETGVVDYLGAIQRYWVTHHDDEKLIGLASFLFEYPFVSLVYPDVFDVVKHLKKWGRTMILTDGDMVFQPYKIKASGLWNLVESNVLICIHKELSLNAIQRRYPSSHYLMVDDKMSILESMQNQLCNRITTVFIDQGHYARESDQASNLFHPDYTIARISELLPIVQQLRHAIIH